jgi:hypothetical protein
MTSHCPQGHRPIIMGGRVYCPDQSHDGRPKTHPLGFAARTPAFFSDVPTSPAPPQSSPAARKQPDRIQIFEGMD